ncbi:MAG TPA: hypothetical protein VNT33_02190, partial [Telluria sp.]|nr:hypothetical protein [Telluria sp.]
MTNTALSSNDHGKLFVFALLLLPPTVFLAGAIPFLFIVFGLVMLRKTQDFGHIETAARNSKIYCALLAAGFAIGAVAQRGEFEYQTEAMWILFGFSAAALFYIAVIHLLFLHPLRKHREWVEQNGIFVGRAKAAASDADGGAIDIIKGERLRSFSVADELLKWAKLKE